MNEEWNHLLQILTCVIEFILGWKKYQLNDFSVFMLILIGCIKFTFDDYEPAIPEVFSLFCNLRLDLFTITKFQATSSLLQSLTRPWFQFHLIAMYPSAIFVYFNNKSFWLGIHFNVSGLIQPLIIKLSISKSVAKITVHFTFEYSTCFQSLLCTKLRNQLHLLFEN